MRHTTLATCITVLSLCGCDPFTGPTETRVLGIVATSDEGIELPEPNPNSWIVQGREVRVVITTVGACKVTRADWQVTQREDYLGGGLVFILPYEYRSTSCPSSPERYRRVALFTDTLDIRFMTALEATVRVVSANGSVFDMALDFLHPTQP